jgi:prepilin-type processing-associated H-X9-DG protein
MKRRNRLILTGAIVAVATVGFVVYRLVAEVERRRLDVAMVAQADRGLYLYQMFNNGNLPAASRLCPGHSLEHGFSWLVEILPYIEGAHLYMKLDLNQPWDSARNEDIRSIRFTPNSAEPGNWAFNFWGGPGSTDSSPIVGIAGLGADAVSLPKEDRRVGIFGYGRQTKLADITDGLSSTMMVVTSQRLSGHWMAGGNANVRGLDTEHKPYLGSTGQFGRGGGAAVLFADGSVRWVFNTVNDNLFEALATMHGREPTAELSSIPISSPSQHALFDKSR